jgi:hypothetical protein
MSTAVFSLESTNLKTSCDRLIAFVEAEFAHHCSTDYQKRTEQLKTLLWKFVEFKGRLERQRDMYYFVWFQPNNPFCAENMNDLTGECPPNGVVKCSLSPALYKIQPGYDVRQSTLVEKASVKTSYSES